MTALALLFSGIFWLPLIAVVGGLGLIVLVVLMLIGAAVGPGTPPPNR